MREKFAYFKKSYDLCTAISESDQGEMVEWSITPVLKTGVLRGTGGSNPSLSAKKATRKGCLLALSGFLTPAGVLRFAQAQAERIPLSARKATRKGCLLALLRFLFLFLFFLMRVWEVLVAVADFFFPRFDGLQLVCLVVFSCPISSESHSSVFFGFLLQR